MMRHLIKNKDKDDLILNNLENIINNGNIESFNNYDNDNGTKQTKNMNVISLESINKIEKIFNNSEEESINESDNDKPNI